MRQTIGHIRTVATAISLFALLLAAGFLFPHSSAAQDVILVDDFEADREGQTPRKWRRLSIDSGEYEPLDAHMDDRRRFYVASEGGNKYLRAYTHGGAQRISIPPNRLNWSLRSHTVLEWKWRARRLPPGAREDKVNDSGGAVYVTFDKRDWLGRPLSIKYVYSTILPVGEVVSFGNVKVIVASSGVDGERGWTSVRRNVKEDYRRLFGEDAPEQPVITLWSDSDNTGSEAEVHFDDIALRAGTPG